MSGIWKELKSLSPVIPPPVNWPRWGEDIKAVREMIQGGSSGSGGVDHLVRRGLYS